MTATNAPLHHALSSFKDNKTTVDIEAMEANAKIFRQVILTLTVVLGSTGNAMVIWVAGFKLRPNVTNVWLVNLAVADFIFSISRILTLVKYYYDYWPFGLFLCKFNGFFKYANMFCSVFLLAVISLDRALCVWRPVFTKRHRTLIAARLLSVGVWVVAVVLSSPYFVYRHVSMDKNNLSSRCSLEMKLTTTEDSHTAKMALYSIRFLCGFLLPFLVIVCCYTFTVIGIRRRHFSGKSHPLRIVAALVCAFFLCWAPYHFILLLKMVDSKYAAVTIGMPLTSSVAYFNSCVNPLMYFCMGMVVRGDCRCSLAEVYRRALDVETNKQTLDDSSVSGTHLSMMGGGGGGGQHHQHLRS